MKIWKIGKNFFLPPKPKKESVPNAHGFYQTLFETGSPRRIRMTAIVIALLFHLALFFIVFPQSREKIYNLYSTFTSLKPMAAPPAGEKEKTTASKPAQPVKNKSPVPFPDPTPDEPEPLFPPAPTTVSIIDTAETVIDIGEITGPPGEKSGTKTGGPPEDSIYREGGAGVVAPVILSKPLPLYTEEARRQRIKGTVQLKVIINKEGRVSQVEIIKSLNPGLDESAVKTVKEKWKFRPATLNGQPVLFEAIIEVVFTLL